MTYNGDMNICIVCGSGRIKGLSMCENHLKKYRRGTLALPEGVVPVARKATNDEERFAKYIEVTGFCWLWQGATATAGYGCIRINDVLLPAHRWVYETLVGPIPPGLDLDHLCRVRPCVNPDHLEPVTRAENLRRGRVSRGLVTA